MIASQMAKKIFKKIFTLTIMSEYVHQGKEIYLATVLAGNGVQVPLRIYHAVCY